VEVRLGHDWDRVPQKVDTPIGYTNAKLVLYPGLVRKQLQDQREKYNRGLLMLDNITMDK
jgi:hypothetical protein